jgi:carboxyl-terminal processing protease
MTELQSEADVKGENGAEDVDHAINVPIVVICNEYTASSGEIFTAAVRDYRDSKLLKATIVGTTTYKKGIMQNTYTYVDGSSATFTVAYYNPPCGINYHGVGVSPDVKVELPEAERDPETGDLLPVNDTQLEAAIEEMNKLINAK